MDQAIERRVIKLLPERQRPADPRGEEISVDGDVAFLRQQPHRDQALGIEIAGAEGPPILPPDIDEAARRDRLGGAVHADFVGEYPGAADAGPAALGKYDGFA